jgi:hypothetical protein
MSEEVCQRQEFNEAAVVLAHEQNELACTCGLHKPPVR